MPAGKPLVVHRLGGNDFLFSKTSIPSQYERLNREASRVRPIQGVVTSPLKKIFHLE
jgi:hypothetical protein